MSYIHGYRINQEMNSHTDTYYYTPIFTYKASPLFDDVEAVFTETEMRLERPNQNLVHLGIYIENEVLGKITCKITGNNITLTLQVH